MKSIVAAVENKMPILLRCDGVFDRPIVKRSKTPSGAAEVFNPWDLNLCDFAIGGLVPISCEGDG